MAFNFKTIFSSVGAEKLKAAFAGALEPALIFAATGSKAAAAWGGMKAVILNNILGPMALLSGSVLGVIGAVKALVANTEMLRKGMEKLKKVEFTEAQFKGLLGGVQLAKERVEELYEFANSTPFQMAGVAEASRLLQVLTKGALATTSNLRLIGDAAATAGADFANVSLHVGRMYDGLQSGRPVGESAARLQELGLMSGQARAKVEAMTKAGNSFTEVWSVVEKELKKNEGGMKTLSETIIGLETTLADAQDKMQAGFAKGFLEAEKMSLERARDTAIALQKPLEKLGEIFGSVAKVGNFISGIFLKIAGGAKGLSNALNFVIEAFLVLGTAILTQQFLHLVTQLGAARAAFFSAGKGALFFNTAQLAANGSIKGALASLKGLTLANKLVGASAIFAGGAFKLARMLVLSFTASIKAAFTAMLAHPIMAIIAGLAALGVAIYRVVQARKAEAEAGAKARAATKELTDEYREQISAIDSTAAKNQVLTSIYEKVKSAAKEAGEAQAMVDDGIFTDEGVSKAQALEDRTSALLYLMNEIAMIDEDRLRVSQARLDLIQKEIELQKEQKELAFDQNMATANDAEKVTLLIKKREELEELTKEGGKTAENMARAQEEAEIQAVRVMRQKAEAQQEFGTRAAALAKLQENMESDEGDAIQNFLASPMGQEMEAKARKDKRFQRGGLEKGLSYIPAVALGNMMANEDLQFGTEDFNRTKFIDFLKKGGGGDPDYAIDPADIQRQLESRLEGIDELALDDRIAKTGTVSFAGGFMGVDGKVKSGREDVNFDEVGRLGKVAAIESTLQLSAQGRLKLQESQKQTLEKIKEELVQEGKEYNKNMLRLDKINNQITVIGDNLRNAATLRLIDEREIEALRKITAETLDAEREKLEIQKRANKERLSAFDRAYGSKGGKSTQDAEKAIQEMEIEKRNLEEKLAASFRNSGGEKTDETDSLQQEIRGLDQNILLAKTALEQFNQAAADTKKFTDAIKAQEDALAKLERQAIKTFNRLKEDLEIVAASNEVDFRFDIGDISGAMDMMEKLGEMENAKFVERRTEELSKKMGGKEAREMALAEARERKRAQSEEVQGNAAKARRAQELAEVQLAARMGDPAAKAKATAMEDRDFIEQAFRKNLGDSKDPMDVSMAKSAALSELMTKKLGEVPEIKTVADSFRSIGAGGAAASTDPQVIMARKRTEALAAMAKLTQEMKGIQLDTKEVIDNRLNFDVK